MNFLLIAFIVTAILIAIALAEIDSYKLSILTMVASIASLDILFGFPVWETIQSNIFSILLFVGLYIAIGAAYTATWRWPEYLRDQSIAITHAYNSWRKSSPASTKQDFKKSYDYREFTASGNYAKLTKWVFMWPFSLAWELSRKPAIWLWTTVYDLLGNLFERVGDRVTDKILRDEK